MLPLNTGPPLSPLRPCGNDVLAELYDIGACDLDVHALVGDFPVVQPEVRPTLPTIWPTEAAALGGDAEVAVDRDGAVIGARRLGDLPETGGGGGGVRRPRRIAESAAKASGTSGLIRGIAPGRYLGGDLRRGRALEGLIVRRCFHAALMVGAVGGGDK